MISTNSAYRDGYNSVATQKLGLVTSSISIFILHGDEYFFIMIIIIMNEFVNDNNDDDTLSLITTFESGR